MDTSKNPGAGTACFGVFLTGLPKSAIIKEEKSHTRCIMDFYEGAYPASYERHSDTTFRKRYFSLRGRINRKRYLFRQLLLWLISVAASALLEPHFPASPVHMPAGVWESVQLLFGATAYAAPVGAASGTHGVVSVLCGLIGLLCCISSLTLTWRRIHDRDHTGLFFLLLCIPVVNLVVAFQLTFCGARPARTASVPIPWMSGNAPLFEHLCNM